MFAEFGQCSAQRVVSVGANGCHGRAIDGLLQPACEGDIALRTAVLVCDHVPCAAQQPRQGVVRHVLQPPTCDREHFADGVISGIGVDSPASVTPDRAGMLIEERLEPRSTLEFVHSG